MLGVFSQRNDQNSDNFCPDALDTKLILSSFILSSFNLIICCLLLLLEHLNLWDKYLSYIYLCTRIYLYVYLVDFNVKTKKLNEPIPSDANAS